MTTNRKNDKLQILKFQSRQPNRTTMARTLNFALLLGQPIERSQDSILNQSHISAIRNLGSVPDTS